MADEVLQQQPTMELIDFNDLKDSKDKKEPKEKKDKKDKKDKKEKKDKKDKKEKKDKAGAEVNDLGERFRPVPNPLFTQSPQDSPLSSTKSSEDLTLSSTPNTPTPTELQGFVSQKYMPSSGYAHLDPSKYENSHSAFDNLQKLVQHSSPPRANVTPPMTNKMHPHQQPRQESHSHPPLQPLPRLSPQQRPPQQRPSPQQQQSYSQQPRSHPQQYPQQQRYPQQPINPQQMQAGRPPQQRPMNGSHKTSPGMPQQIKSRPDKMPDGAPVLQYGMLVLLYKKVNLSYLIKTNKHFFFFFF
jgi:hypothetical protein